MHKTPFIFLFCSALFIISCKKDISICESVKYYGVINPKDSLNAKNITIDIKPLLPLFEEWREFTKPLPNGTSSYLTFGYKGKYEIIEIIFSNPYPARIVTTKRLSKHWYCCSDSTSIKQWEILMNQWRDSLKKITQN